LNSTPFHREPIGVNAELLEEVQILFVELIVMGNVGLGN
jgi:hypothetical protein